MKKIIVFFLILQATFAGSAHADTKLSVVSGVWNRGGTPTVDLFQVVSGRLEVLSTYVLQEDKKFGFAFEVQKEGFYVIGAGNPRAKNDKYTFYFKPGDALSIEVNDSIFTLTGKNTEENIVLANWQQYMQPLAFKSIYFWKTMSTYVDFFPLLQDYLKKPYVAKSTKNPVFNRLYAQYQNIDFLNIASLFLNTPRSMHPETKDYPDYYLNINLPELTKDDFLLKYPDGVDLMARLIKVKNMIANKNPLDVTIEDKLSGITNDLLKGELLIQEAAYFKSYLGFTELMSKYGKYITLPDQKERASEIATHLAVNETKPGQPAIDFSGTDSNGKTVSLSDFKGKMVMVDIWATWCGPCIKEMPFIEKLMEDYHGKDIVFMGVSVDVPKDKPKWEKFLKDKNLQGVQLFSGNGWESDIAKFYQVNSIPRFLLFDKQGNIISTDAPRPSSPEIRQLIDNGLK